MNKVRPFKSFLFLIALTSIIVTGCYKPVANRTDEFENEKTDEPESVKIANNEDPVNSSELPINSETNKMTKPEKEETEPATGYRGNLNRNIEKHGYSLANLVDENNPVEKRLLAEYGAVFLTRAVPPSKVMFTSENEVLGFQTKAVATQVKIGGIALELQRAAAQALVNASNEARSEGASITPRDPNDSARRSYAHTFTLWNGRFTKACEHWKSKGKLTSEKISSLKSLPIKQQVAEVLKLEASGIYFSTNFDKSILYSVAAPGTSQHLSMLAFDANEFGNKKVRKIMAKHGWFRTVQSDEPHFTYLGHSEKDLSSLGLKKVDAGKGEFWIPDV